MIPNPVDSEFLLKMLSTPSPSGWESAGQAVWAGRLQQSGFTVQKDSHGNHWVESQAAQDPADPNPKSATILLEAHADEIGFIVRHVHSNGFLSIGPLGGSDRTLAPARAIRIFGSKGPVNGVIGNTAIHLRKNNKDSLPEWKDLFVDVGAKSPADVSALGIRVGHPAIYASDASFEANGRLIGRAIDNRIGGFVLARVMETLLAEKSGSPHRVLALNAIQEEIGSKGAVMAINRLKPGIAIVFDVTHATDTPGIDHSEHGEVKLGGGPSLSHGAANHPGIVQRLIELGEKENIPLQHEAISRSTATDTDVIYTAQCGIPSALISIPLRYMHSPVETVDMQDVEHAIRLTVAFLQDPHSAEFAE